MAYPNDRTNIGTLLSKELQMRLDPKTIAKQFCSRQYETGLKEMGQSVLVENIGAITWTDISGRTLTASTPGSNNATITVQQKKGVMFDVDDIEQLRATFNLEGGLLDATAQGLAETQESHIFTQIASAVASGHATHGSDLNVGAPVGLTTANIIAAILDMRTQQAKNNASGDNVLFVDPEISALMIESGKFQYTPKGYENMLDGFVARFAGFNIYESNLLPANKMIAWKKNRVHFIEQLTKIKVIDNPDNIGLRNQGNSYFQAALVGSDVPAATVYHYSI